MKQSNAVAYLRQLCCLGLPSDLVIKEFLTAVQTVIPSQNNVYAGVNEQCMPTATILEHVTTEVIELVPFVLPAFFTHERSLRYGSWFKEHSSLTEPDYLEKHFYKSDLFNLLWKPLDQYHFIQASVVLNGKLLGFLSLHRQRLQKPFTKKDETMCVQLTPYIAHALKASSSNDIRYLDNESLGMMVLDTEGSVVYLSESAKSLLALTDEHVISTDRFNRNMGIFPKLTQLCQNLNDIFQGKEALPPSLCYTNANGRFLIRAFWLDKKNNEPSGLIGMTIEHQEPLKLKILRILQKQPLSPAQKEVAFLLAQGFTYDKIGEHLHIKFTTVKDHIGKIYSKLDIHARDELLPKLLALDSSSAKNDRLSEN